MKVKKIINQVKNSHQQLLKMEMKKLKMMTKKLNRMANIKMGMNHQQNLMLDRAVSLLFLIQKKEKKILY
jgi:hypothetical protein